MCLNVVNPKKTDCARAVDLYVVLFENKSGSTHKQEADAPTKAAPMVLSNVT